MTRHRLGPVLALFERSLRVDSRSWLWTASRGALPTVVLLAMFPMQTMFRYGSVGAPGLMFFRSMTWTTFALMTLAGLSFFSAAIAEEKEEMTLGLLRMTGLSPVGILFGKSTARLAGSLLLLATTLPFTLLAVTLGGVATVQVMATYATLAAYLFFMANMALLWSVVSPRPAHATALTGLTLVFVYLVPTLLEGMLPAWHPKPPVAWRQPVLLASQVAVRALPTSALRAILRTGFSGPVAGLSALALVGGGVMFFALSWAVFDRCTREQRELAPLRGVMFRRGARRGRVPAAVAGSEAVAWKDYTFMGGGHIGAVLRVLLAGGMATAVSLIPRMLGERNTPRSFVSACFLFIPLGVAGLGFALDAGRIFNQEWQWKTLSSLMVMPFSTGELVWRKVRASLKQVLPVLSLLVVSFLVAPQGWIEFLSNLATRDYSGEMGGVFLMMLTQYVMFLSLTAFLSLVLKRGAFAAAVAILYLGMGFLMMPLGMLLSLFGARSATSFFAVAFLPAVGIIGLLWVGIVWRLQRIAAEG